MEVYTSDLDIRSEQRRRLRPNHHALSDQLEREQGLGRFDKIVIFIGQELLMKRSRKGAMHYNNDLDKMYLANCIWEQLHGYARKNPHRHGGKLGFIICIPDLGNLHTLNKEIKHRPRGLDIHSFLKTIYENGSRQLLELEDIFTQSSNHLIQNIKLRIFNSPIDPRQKHNIPLHIESNTTTYTPPYDQHGAPTEYSGIPKEFQEFIMKHIKKIENKETNTLDLPKPRWTTSNTNKEKAPSEKQKKRTRREDGEDKENERKQPQRRKHTPTPTPQKHNHEPYSPSHPELDYTETTSNTYKPYTYIPSKKSHNYTTTPQRPQPLTQIQSAKMTKTNHKLHKLFGEDDDDIIGLTEMDRETITPTPSEEEEIMDNTF